jgi:hypothetical protein
MPEAQWQANTTRLALQLMSAGARAVYQGQLPLQLAASLDLGCVAAVTPAARSRQLGEGFDLRELQVGVRVCCSCWCFRTRVHVMFMLLKEVQGMMSGQLAGCTCKCSCFRQ